MTDQAYIAAYQKIVSQYDNNQSSMEEYLAAIQKLKDQYLKENTTLSTRLQAAEEKLRKVQQTLT